MEIEPQIWTQRRYGLHQLGKPNVPVQLLNEPRDDRFIVLSRCKNTFTRCEGVIHGIPSHGAQVLSARQKMGHESVDQRLISGLRTLDSEPADERCILILSRLKRGLDVTAINTAVKASLSRHVPHVC